MPRKGEMFNKASNPENTGGKKGRSGGARPGNGRLPGQSTRATVQQRRTLAQLAKEHTQTALMTLVEICKDKQAPAAARVTAANSILDRGYGRAPQAIQHEGTDGAPLFSFLQKLASEDAEEEGEIPQLSYQPEKEELSN